MERKATYSTWGGSNLGNYELEMNNRDVTRSETILILCTKLGNSHCNRLSAHLIRVLPGLPRSFSKISGWFLRHSSSSSWACMSASGIHVFCHWTRKSLVPETVFWSWIACTSQSFSLSESPISDSYVGLLCVLLRSDNGSDVFWVNVKE